VINDTIQLNAQPQQNTNISSFNFQKK